MDNRTSREGLLLIVAAAAGYALFPIFTKTIYETTTFEPMDVLKWRFLLAAPIIWLILGGLKRNNEEAGTPDKALPRPQLLLMGLLFAFTAGSAFLALDRIPASTFTIIIYTYPAMVALMSLFLGERLSARGWVALALTLVGVALTAPDFSSGFDDAAGVFFTLLNAVTYAVYIVISGRLLRGHRALARAGAWSISGAALAAGALALFDGLPIPNTLAAWGGLLGLAVCCTVVANLAFYAGMQRLGAARASILSTVEPVMTLILAGLVLGERLEAQQVVGAALILASVILLQLRRGPKAALNAEYGVVSAD